MAGKRPDKAGVQLHLEIDGWQEAMARETSANSPLADSETKKTGAQPLPDIYGWPDFEADAPFWPDRPKGTVSALPYYKIGKPSKIDRCNALFLPRGADYLERLASWAADFSAPDFSAGEVKGGEKLENGGYSAPYYSESKTAYQFHTYCYFDGWVRPQIHWMAWTDTPRGNAVLKDRLALADADLDELVMLITTILRADRISEGYFGSRIEDGTMLAICRRAEVLAAERAAQIKPQTD